MTRPPQGDPVHCTGARHVRNSTDDRRQTRQTCRRSGQQHPGPDRPDLQHAGLLTAFTCFGCVGLPLLGIGTILCITGCFIRPRILAAVGLCVGLLAIFLLGALLALGLWRHTQLRGAHGLTPMQADQIAESCSALTTEVEKMRSMTGNLPVAFNIGTFPDHGLDPWNHWYRYTVVPVTAANKYGYTFMSDGPDGIAGTADDLDIIAIHPADDEDNPLPVPPSPPAPAGAPQSAP